MDVTESSESIMCIDIEFCRQDIGIMIATGLHSMVSALRHAAVCLCRQQRIGRQQHCPARCNLARQCLVRLNVGRSRAIIDTMARAMIAHPKPQLSTPTFHFMTTVSIGLSRRTMPERLSQMTRGYEKRVKDQDEGCDREAPPTLLKKQIWQTCPIMRGEMSSS